MKLSKNISHKKGFTLIELLIVIGILGILAVGLLAAVNPVEQLRKGRDTTKKGVSVEIVNANARYFGTTGNAMWDTTPPPPFTALAPVLLNAAAVATYIDTLQTAAELKTGFEQGIAQNGGSITIAGATNGDMIACFIPESTADRANFSQLFAANTIGAGVCPTLAAAQAGTCYFCAQ